MPPSGMSVEKLQRMQESVRTGGKGSVRRKKKAQHKTTGTDDKRLQNTLKRLGVNNIPAIEEVNLFTSDGRVIHFSNPKVQASIAADNKPVPAMTAPRVQDEDISASDLNAPLGN